jgi:iron complex outermembrane recepter protein
MKKLYSYLKLSLLAVICLLGMQVIAQTNGTISGIISTSDGKPASAVSVILKELNKSTITLDNGSFVLKNVKPGTYTLKTAYIGLQSQEKQVSVTAGEKATVEFVLAENAQKLSDVVVTGYKSANQKPVSAGKVAIKSLDNPQMVSVIGSQVIADQQINRLSDVIKNVNGVNLGSSRGGVQETFYARGYSLSSTNVFKNGSRVSSGVIPEASTLESVEVLKGSAALLYGNVTSGAVLNMVTKQPKYDFGGEVSIRSGSYGLYKPTVDVYGPITKKLAFRAIGTTENAESFRQNVKSDRIYINPSLLYTFNNKTSLLVQGDYLKYNNTPDFGVGSMKVLTSDGGTAKFTIPSISRSSFFNTSWAYNKAKQATVSANVNHEINNNWKVNSILSYQESDRNTFGAERIQAESNGDYNRFLARTKSNEKYYNGQINLNGVFKTGFLSHNLLIGTDAEQFRTVSNAFAYASGGSLSATSYDMVNLFDPSKNNIKPAEPEIINTVRTTTPVYRFGYYAQDMIEISSKFKILAGLRWTYQKTAVAKSLNLASGVITPSPSRYDRAFSPKVGIVYQPLKTSSVFASYTNNFIVNTGTTADLQALEPSIVDQYEVGVKNDFLDGKLSANISAYRIFNDKTYVTSATNTAFREIGGETTSDGVELDVNGTLIPGMNFIAGYSYNFIRYTKTTGLKNSYVTDERLVGSAAHTANGTLFYTLKSGKLRGVKLGATANYMGKRNGGWNNQNDPGKVWTKNTGQNDKLYEYNRLIPISAYTTVDFSAGYSFRRFALLAKLSNISNELNYVVHENYSVNPIAPRQFATTFSYKF